MGGPVSAEPAPEALAAPVAREVRAAAGQECADGLQSCSSWVGRELVDGLVSRLLDTDGIREILREPLEKRIRDGPAGVHVRLELSDSLVPKIGAKLAYHGFIERLFAETGVESDQGVGGTGSECDALAK